MHAALLAVLLGPLAPAPAPLAHASAVQETEAPLVWVEAGEPGARSPAIRDALALEDRELSEAFERARLALWATGDRDAAERAYEALRVRAARAGSIQAEVLARIAAARSDLLAETGRLAEALAALEAVVPSAERLRDALGEVALREANEAELAAIEEARAAPALRERRERIAEAREAAEAEAEGDAWLREELDDAQRRYLIERHGVPSRALVQKIDDWSERGDRGKVVNLGYRATPALAYLALASIDGIEADRYEDPIDLLVQVDESAGATLLRDWVDAGDVAWKRRVLEVLSERANLFRTSRWRFARSGLEEVRDGVPDHPEWLGVLEVLVADPRIRQQALAIAHFAVEFDGLTDRLTGFLVEELRSREPGDAIELLESLDPGHRSFSMIPLFRAGLESPDAELRLRCLEGLHAFEYEPSLARLAEDPDPRVRRKLTAFLTQRSAPILRTNATESKTYVGGRVGPALADLWVRLLQDEDALVRTYAVSSLTIEGKEVPLEVWDAALASSDPAVRAEAAVPLTSNPAVLNALEPSAARELRRRMLADPLPAVRERLLHLPSGDVAAQTEELTALAADPDPGVLRTLDDLVLEPWSEDCAIEALAAAFRVRMRNDARSFPSSGGGESGWDDFARGEVGWTALELSTLIRVGLEHGIDALVEIALAKWAGPNQEELGHATADLSMLRALEPGEMAELFAWGFPGRERRRELAVDWISSFAGHDLVSAVAAMRSLFLDESRPVGLRAFAGSRIDPTWSAEGKAALRAILRDPAWSAGGAQVDHVESLARALPDSNELLLEVLADERISEVVKQSVANEVFDHDGPRALEAARAILDAWLGGEARALECVGEALESLGRAEAEPWVIETLIEASKDPRTMLAAIRGMDRLGSPAFVDPLGASLASRAVPDPNQQYLVQSAAARALLRYGTPEAAEHLRDGLLTADSRSREVIRTCLDALRAYHEERARLEEPPLASRERALAELVGMLDGESAVARAEAARALATFGAIEAIPELIPLLEDPDEAVRAAARAALDALHEAEGARAKG